ncbi:MAG: glycosyltransferase family 2 protein [Stomatobaculum sp.]|nr:glycosyltransferase family 2 protein [Stomatobaculum sp.]
MKSPDKHNISVIIPVYNGAAVLESCVRSVISAGNRVAEIIIVDDGSVDGTSEKADSLAIKDRRIQVIHTENHGSYTARLTGIRAAASPYIAFCDADDRFFAGALDLLADLLETCDADTAFGGFVETEDLETEDPAVKQPRKAEIYVRTQEELWPRIMKWKTQEFFCYLWNKVYRKEVFSDLLEAEGLCQGDDVLLTCQAYLRVRKAVETTAPVYLYWRNPGSLTRTAFGDRDLDLIAVWDTVVKIMEGKTAENRRQDLQYLAQYNRWRTDFTLICRLILADSRESDRKYAAELKKWRKGLKAHWKELLRKRAMPHNRELLILGLCFMYTPTRFFMRAGGRLIRWKKKSRQKKTGC